MRGDLTRQINVRLDADTIDAINELIQRGDFSNVAEFIRYSAKYVLRGYEGRTPPPHVNRHSLLAKTATATEARMAAATSAGIAARSWYSGPSLTAVS